MMRLACLLSTLCVAFVALPGPLCAASEPAGIRQAVLSYMRARGSGDYAAAFGQLTAADRSYFKNLANYASVFKADRFSSSGTTVLKVTPQKTSWIVTVRETIHFYDHGLQIERSGRITVPLVVVREPGGFRMDDTGHPYRSILPSSSLALHRARVSVRKISFFLRRIEVTLAFENDGTEAITFLPYGRSLLRDARGDVFRPFETRNWLLTDRQLFLGLRLAGSARYTGQINFQATGRVGDAAGLLTLVVGPALPEGGDEPLTFELPPIAVPAP